MPRIESAFVLVLAGLLVGHALFFHYTVDDAFISYRYAANYADGNGLVFNVGDRVEGYTNFFWTVTLALVTGLGQDPVLWSRILGLACGVATMFLCYAAVRRRSHDHPVAILAPVALAANGAFALWCAAGLETVAFALFVTAGLLAGSSHRSRGPVWCASFLGLAAVTRPEGVLFFAVVWFHAAVSRKHTVRTLLGSVALFAALVLPLYAWRYGYYAEFLPNTWFAKSGGGMGAMARGVKYIGTYFGPFGGWTSAALVPLVFLVRVRHWERTLLAAVLIWLVYVVSVGGDSLAFYRFLVPVIPAITVLALSGVAKLFPVVGEARVSPSRMALLFVLLALPVYSSFRGEMAQFVGEDRARIEYHWKVIGQWLRENAAPDASIAVTTAGAIPYYSGLRTIDMLGITDKRIARKKMKRMGRGFAGHEKNDMAYVVRSGPTYILHYTFLLPEPVFTTGQFKTPWNPGLKELLDMPLFEKKYKGVSAPIGEMHFLYFERIDS